MINLIQEGTSNTIAINPATGSNYLDLVSGSFRLQITQDYDQSGDQINLEKLPPIPAGYYNNYLLFSVPVKSATGLVYIPSASGNYSYTLEEGIRSTGVWGLESSTWTDADVYWFEEGTFQNRRNLDTGRARVVGNDIPSYISYTGGDQDGSYTTYDK